MKRCSKCQQFKELSCFSKFAKSPDGRQGRCKECDKLYYLARQEEKIAYQHAYYEANKETIAPKLKAYALKNKEHISERHKEYYQQNIEKTKERSNRWRAANPERKLENDHRHYRENAEQRRAYSRQYNQEHPEKMKAYRELTKEQRRIRFREWCRATPNLTKARLHRRRALELNAEGTFTADEWAALKHVYGYHCLACGRREPNIKLTPDHVIPLTKKGRNDIGNIQPLCKSCNSRKQTKTTDYRPLWNQLVKVPATAPAATA
jgi:5-methylcytosine-specific restriction endonuclease McrA